MEWILISLILDPVKPIVIRGRQFPTRVECEVKVAEFQHLQKLVEVQAATRPDSVKDKRPHHWYCEQRGSP